MIWGDPPYRPTHVVTEGIPTYANQLVKLHLKLPVQFPPASSIVMHPRIRIVLPTNAWSSRYTPLLPAFHQTLTALPLTFSLSMYSEKNPDARKEKHSIVNF